MKRIDEVTRLILERRSAVPDSRSLLVGVSGIDGCGKGYLAGQLEAHLALHGVYPAKLNVDGWLNLPEKRFDQRAPAKNFYENAIRFEEFFTQLVIPLRDRRSLPVVLVEGIFIFKPPYREYFDLAIWVDCSFPAALARAINRAQERLSAANTIAAYETIYFPAQRIHLAQDQPRERADLIFENN
jgi:uridine kinase